MQKIHILCQFLQHILLVEKATQRMHNLLRKKHINYITYLMSRHLMSLQYAFFLT
jgi:hypothetical protein